MLRFFTNIISKFMAAEKSVWLSETPQRSGEGPGFNRKCAVLCYTVVQKDSHFLFQFLSK